MSELSSVINNKKISYIDYEDVRKLSSDDLNAVRCEAIDALSSLENRISFINEWDDISALAAVRVHLKRVLSSVNGIIKAKGRAKHKAVTKTKDKLKTANAKIILLEQKVKRMKLYIKQLEAKGDK